MNKTTAVPLSPSTIANLSSLMTRANSDLNMITAGEISRFFEAKDTQELINSAFKNVGRDDHRTIALEGADNLGKTTLAPAIAKYVGGQVFAASTAADQLFKHVGIPASEKSQFFLYAKSLVSLTFFILANMQQLNSSSVCQNNETVSILDGFVFRTFAAHQAKRMLKEEVSGAAEQTFTKLENLMVEKIMGSPSFRFIFLYASPRVRELHLALRGKANEADKN